MALPAGTRLGPYEITGALGAGGMGEVYRARDTRLDRDVAVKVLAPDVAPAPGSASVPGSSRARDDRRSRFEREARAIAALTHPHICTLYDVGHEGETQYLVMELLEGTDLAARLRSGALPVPEALTCAIQIAEALVAAHRQGIVHRDLKPANIMFVRGGPGRQHSVHVKLLDFGLAQLRAERAGESADPVGRHTMTAPLTGQGQILGTLQYMAPEQLEGRPVDARADIFAFGAIVFEMMTGRRAFGGDSAAAAISAILREPVPPVSQAAPAAPPALDRVVDTCLAKDPEDRWSSAHDVLLQLRAIADAAGTDRTVTARAEAGAATTLPRPTRRVRLAWPMGLVAAAVLGGAAGAWLTRPPAAPPTGATVDRLSLLPPDGVTLQRGEAPEISPDGRQVAFVATDAAGRKVLYVRARDSLGAWALPGTDDATLPFWAPDSRHLAFFAGGRLKTVALDGGSPQVIAPAPVARGGTWSRDDRILFVATPSEPPQLVAASGGDVRPVPAPPTAQSAFRSHPVFLPDGRHYLFLTSAGAVERVPSAVHVGAIDAPESRAVVTTAASAAYVEPGYLLFRRGTTLMAQRFDAASLELRGAAQKVADDVGYNSVTYQGLFSASADGVLVYQSSTPTSEMAWFDRQGVRTGTVGPPGDYNALCLSPDGRRVVFDLADAESGAVDLWWSDTTGGAPSRLTFHRAVDFYPVCDPAGQAVVFATLRDGPPNLYRLPLNAPGTEAALLRSQVPKIPSDWSRGGKVLFSVLNRGTGWDIGVVPATGGEPALVVSTPADERNGRLSPDERWLAYVSNESGTVEVYVQPFPATGARWQISRGGGAQPQWRGDGGALVYLAQDRGLVEVPVAPAGGQLHVGEPRALFHTRLTAHEPTNLCCQYAVTGDGSRFVVNTATGNVLPVTVVRNWPALLQP